MNHKESIKSFIISKIKTKYPKLSLGAEKGSAQKYSLMKDINKLCRDTLKNKSKDKSLYVQIIVIHRCITSVSILRLHWTNLGIELNNTEYERLMTKCNMANHALYGSRSKGNRSVSHNHHPITHYEYELS